MSQDLRSQDVHSSKEPLIPGLVCQEVVHQISQDLCANRMSSLNPRPRSTSQHFWYFQYMQNGSQTMYHKTCLLTGCAPKVAHGRTHTCRVYMMTPKDNRSQNLPTKKKKKGCTNAPLPPPPPKKQKKKERKKYRKQCAFHQTCHTYRMYMMTPRDHISQDLSYFSGPSTSGAVNRKGQSQSVSGV